MDPEEPQLQRDAQLGDEVIAYVLTRDVPRMMLAKVTHVWNSCCVNLYVYPDGTYYPSGGTITSAVHGGGINEWHFMEENGGQS